MSAPIKLLLVEDDPNLGSLLAQYLVAKGYDVTHRTDGEQGWEAYRTGRFDLLVLDVMMPRKDGFTLAREIRQKDRGTPIIFLTAKSMKQDTIQGFQSGGDDFVTKPFSMEELLLRIAAVLKRTKGITEEEEPMEAQVIGTFTFDPRKQLLVGGDQERKLTTKESELLRLLCQHRNGLLERPLALQEIWGDDNYFNGRSMDVYIAKLRKYLKADPEVEIVNIHGKGFRLVAKDGQ
ncbi:MAG: response regulator transcription factor [Flavobacteriales bacterium]|nr:response regulator transcription factor [Flavobacteriales bacterium]MCB0808257.1 response regulator transcription factor [Flavobacteriales bacterium]MCB0812640.1 response regulator transcription factor [Flavobacteriales bacterium]MCB9181957.1 response regulator transcription factor [Flavobacteriales bacterium]MCB9201096.1 response regulator transcription factor [Flavobacteriales bacterium]